MIYLALKSNLSTQDYIVNNITMLNESSAKKNKNCMPKWQKMKKGWA